MLKLDSQPESKILTKILTKMTLTHGDTCKGDFTLNGNDRGPGKTWFLSRLIPWLLSWFHSVFIEATASNGDVTSVIYTGKHLFDYICISVPIVWNGQMSYVIVHP